MKWDVEQFTKTIHDAHRSLMSDYDVLSSAAPSLTPKERLFLERQAIYHDAVTKRSALHDWMLCKHGLWLFDPCRYCKRSEKDARAWLPLIRAALARLVS